MTDINISPVVPTTTAYEAHASGILSVIASIVIVIVIVQGKREGTLEARMMTGICKQQMMICNMPTMTRACSPTPQSNHGIENVTICTDPEPKGIHFVMTVGVLKMQHQTTHVMEANKSKDLKLPLFKPIV
mmetsp:Transcript_6399/g.11788  ORF Transcript_6399/g.11788 Transcript_6399/m.11788 type:complete len:131 (-) Transcript_6399:442-834(-)